MMFLAVLNWAYKSYLIKIAFCGRVESEASAIVFDKGAQRVCLPRARNEIAAERAAILLHLHRVSCA